ncbi:MAG: phosphoglucosamine mutase [Candidatus Eisenbacteria bacterium]|nr:phosphoglucosamine mutase [Candidatus Eisenbacteria bacterium]
MSSSLMISVAGVRGIVGESLTPAVVCRFAAAFSHALGEGPVVVGRDARVSGPMVLQAVCAGLTAAGRDVVDIGLATTPATQMAVEHLKAAGGVILTASHNPAPWNALKFLSGRGEFLGPVEGRAVRERFEADRDLWTTWDRLGSVRQEHDSLEWHLERVLGLEYLDLAAIRARRLKVVVDGCASVGGVAVPALLERLGATAVLLDCEPNGRFTRELEPLPEHLGALGRAVTAAGADFGVALDPDADRAAFVAADGVPLGEEFTVALGAQVVLTARKGPVVTNLSTSRMLDRVCQDAGVALHRTPVGEAHVVAGIHAVGAIAGGEGNGGMILPAAHCGRDGLVAVALIAQAMSTGATLRELATRLPQYAMVKDKLARPDEPWEQAALRLRSLFSDWELDTADGMRFARGEEWVHVRPSGTEPVVRVIAETPAASRTREIVEVARQAVQA